MHHINVRNAITMPKELPHSVSINDAAALIVNLDYRPGGTSPLEMLGYFRAEAEAQHDEARGHIEKQRYLKRIQMLELREEFARSVIDAIDAEIAVLKTGGESKLEVVDHAFGEEQIVTGSLFAWAEDVGFGADGWEAPRFWRPASERHFTTAYLAILDDVVATFCEEGGKHFTPEPPKKDTVKAWITDKYGPVSEKVIDVMATIIRPGLTDSTRRKR